MPPLRLLSASLALAFGLTACGGGGSDTAQIEQGTPSTTAQASQGVLVDDLIVGGTVFCDGNSNGELDAGEVSATTDSAGNYTFSSVCFGQIASVADTGYDKSTMQAPRGQFLAKAGSAVVSPFTTMQATSGLSDAEFQTVLSNLGLAGVDVTKFDPTKDSARATTAAAVAKILNDIAEIVQSAGGDAKSAFRAAVTASVAYAKTAQGSVFADTSVLSALVDTAVDAGLSAGNKNSSGQAIWTDTARTNIKGLALNGISTLAASIQQKSSLADTADLLSNNSVANVIKDTDISDSSKVEQARAKLADTANLVKPQYVYLNNDGVSILPLPTTANTPSPMSFTLSQFDSGVSLTGQTLGTLSYVMLPLQGTALALPKSGKTVSLGLEIVNQSTGGTMQAAINKVTLKPASDGTVTATVADDSKTHLYMKTAAGVEIGTGSTPFDGVGSALLADVEGGLAIDLQKLANGMRKRFPDNVSLIDKVVNETGSFKMKVVITELDFRHNNGNRFGTDAVVVKVPGDSTAVAKKVGGTAVTGTVTF